MTLTDNAFAVLGAMPCDNRRALTEKADEAALLGGGNTEDALNQLMQLTRRIPAELAWLPGATQQAADAFLAYARALAEGRSADIPPVDDLGSPLAQANALAALFDVWPAESAEMFLGLCRTLDGILSQITVQDTLDVLNADRQAGGWEVIPDALSLSDPLNDRLRQLCAPIGRAIEKQPDGSLPETLSKLFGRGGIDPQGTVAQFALDAYSMRIHERSVALRDRVLNDAKRLGEASQVPASDLQNLRANTRQWCELNVPLRFCAGPARNDAKAIGHAVRQAVVNYVNKAGTVEKTETMRIPVFNGVKTVTITYQSNSDKVQEALQYTAWLRGAFPEQPELLAQLQADEKALQGILTNEQVMLASARNRARLGK